MQDRLDEERKRIQEEREAREAQEKELREKREQELKEEHERREKEEKERCVENFMFLRFIKLILKNNSDLENARETLFGHSTFSVESCFALFDSSKCGVITLEEFQQVFADHNIEVMDMERIVEIIDLDEDGTVDFKKLSLAVTPQSGAGRRQEMYGLSLE